MEKRVRLEGLLDLFEGFAFGFGQDEGGDEEVEDAGGGPCGEHGGVAVMSDGGEEDSGDEGGDAFD